MSTGAETLKKYFTAEEIFNLTLLGETKQRSDFYTQHAPVISLNPAGNVYEKVEHDQHFFFRNLAAISIACLVLDDPILRPVKVKVDIKLFGVVVEASAELIRAENLIQTHRGETKYYLPVHKWTIVEGNKNWVSDLKISDPDARGWGYNNDLSISGF